MISLNSINRLVCITWAKRVYSTARTQRWKNTSMNFKLRSVGIMSSRPTIHLQLFTLLRAWQRSAYCF